MKYPNPQPTPSSERIGSLDFLRSIAVLGILIINIQDFAYPDPWSPFKYGFASDLDRVTRFWVFFLAQGKFFSMFTLLFGVGFYIFLERLEGKELGLKAMDIYARRLLWLFFLGVIHAYLIWNGDVLYHYAACGFFLFPFRSFSIKQLGGVILLLGLVLLNNAYQSTTANKNQLAAYERSKALTPDQRTPEDTKRIEHWEDKTKKGVGESSAVEVPRSAVYQSWVANAASTKVHKGQVLYAGIFFRTLIMMLLGIALYKSGIFRNYTIVKYYWLITLSLLLIGLAINYLRYYHWTYAYFRPVTEVWKGWLFTFPKEILGLAYVLLFNGIYQKYFARIGFKPLSYIGRMALTNYILQSVVCGLIFYGYGLGKYNSYTRTELLVWVVVIWILQATVSWFWMKRNTQGPLEKIWRKLTYQ